jgi:hypothetical protein
VARFVKTKSINRNSFGRPEHPSGAYRCDYPRRHKQQHGISGHLLCRNHRADGIYHMEAQRFKHIPKERSAAFDYA